MQWKVLTEIPQQVSAEMWEQNPGLSPGSAWWGFCGTITAWCQTGFSSTLLADSFSMITETKDWGEPETYTGAYFLLQPCSRSLFFLQRILLFHWCWTNLILSYTSVLKCFIFSAGRMKSNHKSELRQEECAHAPPGSNPPFTLSASTNCQPHVQEPHLKRQQSSSFSHLQLLLCLSPCSFPLQLSASCFASFFPSLSFHLFFCVGLYF